MRDHRFSPNSLSHDYLSYSNTLPMLSSRYKGRKEPGLARPSRVSLSSTSLVTFHCSGNYPDENIRVNTFSITSGFCVITAVESWSPSGFQLSTRFLQLFLLQQNCFRCARGRYLLVQPPSIFFESGLSPVSASSDPRLRLTSTGRTSRRCTSSSSVWCVWRAFSALHLV